MEEREKDAGTLDLPGRRTRLEFADRAHWHARDQPIEYLSSYAALVAWGQHVGLVRTLAAGDALTILQW